MKPIIAGYSPKIIKVLVYMLQASEYHVPAYFAWLNRTLDFSTVAKRRRLVMTNKAILLLLVSLALYFIYLFFILQLVVRGGSLLILGLVLLAGLPYILGYLLAVPLVAGQLFIQFPRERRMVYEATERLKRQHCHKIAIAGSYGKTTFKETLATILSESFHVAASPGNMNTALGLANFSSKLDGSEDVLIFELGEERTGDVRRLCELTRPNMGVMTGISEAHLGSFGSIENIVATIFELSDYLKSYDVYKNGDSELVAEHVSAHDQHVYSERGVNGWKVSDIETGLEGTSFMATKHGKTVWTHSKLLGRHQVGPLVACIDIADKLGMGLTDIAEGIKKTIPFEHRMQPYRLSGAIVIDDTYNGNPKGVQAGLDFLDNVPAKRKVYVTPGLVGQGNKSAEIHEAIGRQAAGICDVVVLMKNSTTDAIIKGLNAGQFTGALKVVDDPVAFYNGLQHFVAAGDVVLMQNDWTDNYA